MIDAAMKTFGSLDILVNNAGIMDGMVPSAELTDELWERVLGVNVAGPMRAIRKALPICEFWNSLQCDRSWRGKHDIMPEGSYVNSFGAVRAMIGMNLNPRMGEASEIAKVALFLASDDSSFINGTVITADLGWTAY